MVEGADSLFMQRVSTAMNFRSAEFWRSFREAERRLEDARWRCYTVTQNIPYEWTIESWEKRAEGIEGEVEKALAEGSDPVALRNGLLAASAQFKELDDVVKQAVKTGKTVKDNGMATLIFRIEDNELRLYGIRGKVLFGLNR